MSLTSLLSYMNLLIYLSIVLSRFLVILNTFIICHDHNFCDKCFLRLEQLSFAVWCNVEVYLCLERIEETICNMLEIPLTNYHLNIEYDDYFPVKFKKNLYLWTISFLGFLNETVKILFLNTYVFGLLCLKDICFRCWIVWVSSLFYFVQQYI